MENENYIEGVTLKSSNKTKLSFNIQTPTLSRWEIIDTHLIHPTLSLSDIKQ